MEGKEARFGLGQSALFASATTGTSTGAVNNMHDSLTPLGGMVPLFLILTERGICRAASAPASIRCWPT